MNPAKKKWGGTRKPGTGSRLVETADASNIALLQEKIDAIKKELREKSPLLQVWGTLADLYAASRREDQARRVYLTLASGGLSRELREQAVSRLAALSGR